MCWVGEANNRKIAKEDIKTKKIVESIGGCYLAYYQKWFGYELGKTYTAKISPREWVNADTKRVIDVGLHSYAWDMEVKRMCGGDIKVKSLGYLGGTTTFINRHSPLSPNYKIVVVECTIPKGTVYWENAVGEIVSENLIIEGEIEIEDDCNFC